MSASPFHGVRDIPLPVECYSAEGIELEQKIARRELIAEVLTELIYRAELRDLEERTGVRRIGRIA